MMDVWIWVAAAVGVGVLTYVALPKLLNLLGLHPHYDGPRHDLSGKRALIVTTSQATLGDTRRKTGVWASEMTVPYYEFLAAGMQVDLASIRGGEIPIEPSSLRWPVASPTDRRFLADPEFLAKTERSLKIDDLDFGEYDLVYLASGWGAAYDLGPSTVLGRKLSEAYAAERVLGAVCHGGLGFLKATYPDGKPLLEGLHATAVSDKQIRELGITQTPQHPETELRKAGALYEKQSGLLEVLSNHIVVDGRIVTGQNQNAGAEVAHKMMALLEEYEPI
jgi:putative intracellular protease/amidase